MYTRIVISKRKIKNMSFIDLFFHNVKRPKLFQETYLILSRFNITKDQIKPSRISKKKCTSNETVDTA